MYSLHVLACAPTVSVHVSDETIDGLLEVSPRHGFGHQSALGQPEVRRGAGCNNISEATDWILGNRLVSR